MTWRPTRTPDCTANQRGAAAIEFALVFPIFLLLFFGLMFFGVSLTLQHNLNHAAQNAARAGLAVDPDAYPSPAAYESKIRERAKAEADLVLAWMSPALKSAIKVDSAVTTADGVYWLDVSVTLPKSSHPLATLAGFLSLDEFTDLTGQAKLRL